MEAFALRLNLEGKEKTAGKENLSEIKNELKQTAEQIMRAETRFNFLTDENLI